MVVIPCPTYEGQGFLKDVGGFPTWCGGGVVYDFGRRGGKAVTEDDVDMFLVVLSGVYALEEMW